MARQTIVGAVGIAAAPRHRLFAGPAENVFQAGPAFLAAEELERGERNVLCALDGYLFEPERLAARLRATGPISDARLLARAYLAWGEAMLDVVHGEFAFALWQPDQGRGLIARDRSGTRPMFYAPQGRRIYFASEVKELVAMLPQRPGPDDAAVSWALSEWSIHDDRTLFAGVSRLGAGTALRIAADGFSQLRFWRAQPAEPPDISREEAVEGIRTLVRRAVGRRVRDEDVPAVQLSGGLDSSAVAALSAADLAGRGKRLRGYSAVFPDVPEADEAAQLDVLAAGIDVEQVRLSVRGGSPVAAAMRFLELWEVPLGPPNFFVWEPLLRRSAADGVSVMLDGNGGDELFGAAPYLLADRLRRGGLLDAARLARQIPEAGWGRREVARSLLEWGVDGMLPAWIGERREAPELPLLTAAACRWFREGRERSGWRRRGGPRWWSWKAHLLTSGVEALSASDHRRRAVESAGLAARHPLLDPDLMDFVLSLPPEWSFDPLLTRPLLREAAAGFLPDEIRMRREKAVFGRVFAAPLHEHDLPAIRRLLGGDGNECLRYVDRTVLESELLEGPGRNPRGEAAWALETWRVLNLELWLRLQSDPASGLGFPLPEVAAEGGLSHFLHP